MKHCIYYVIENRVLFYFTKLLSKQSRYNTQKVEIGKTRIPLVEGVMDLRLCFPFHKKLVHFVI